MNLVRKHRHLFIFTVLPFILWLFFSQVAFWHFHVLDNGRVVEHAHPYSKSKQAHYPYPGQNHRHTDLEYSILAQVSNVLITIGSLLAVAFVLHALPAARPPIYLAPAHVEGKLKRIFLRGPPAWRL